MIKVLVYNNVNQEIVFANSNETLRSALEKTKFDFSRGDVYLDGASLAAADLDKTFDDFHITEECALSMVVKARNA